MKNTLQDLIDTDKAILEKKKNRKLLQPKPCKIRFKRLLRQSSPDWKRPDSPKSLKRKLLMRRLLLRLRPNRRELRKKPLRKQDLKLKRRLRPKEERQRLKFWKRT